MPADYTKIREENIARYGWDTAVLDLLGQLYSERTHFIFELIQNAEDAAATEVAFELFEDRLELRHDGRPFTEADVRGVCGVGKSGKAGDLTAIGKFGIGFKSVYAYTRSPRIHSTDEHFRIENYVRPFPAEPLPFAGTLFVFPFDHDTVPAATPSGRWPAALSALQPGSCCSWGTSSACGSAARGSRNGHRAFGSPGRAPSGGSRCAADGGARSGWSGPARPRASATQRHRSRSPPGRGRPRRAMRQLAADSLSSPPEGDVLGFLVQVQPEHAGSRRRPWAPSVEPGPGARDRRLLCDVLRELRDKGLLTVEALQALPLDAARFGLAACSARSSTQWAGLDRRGTDPGRRRRVRRRRRPGAGQRPGSARAPRPDQLMRCPARADRSRSPMSPSPSPDPCPMALPARRDRHRRDHARGPGRADEPQVPPGAKRQWITRFYAFLFTDSAVAGAPDPTASDPVRPGQADHPARGRPPRRALRRPGPPGPSDRVPARAGRQQPAHGTARDRGLPRGPAVPRGAEPHRADMWRRCSSSSCPGTAGWTSRSSTWPRIWTLRARRRS